MSHPRSLVSRQRRLVAVSVVAAALVLGACADSGESTGGQGSSDGADEDDRGTAPVDESGVDPWLRTAVPHRGEIGDEIDIECPERGVLGQVWGTGVYTDDSSICTAAVHVGLIDFDDGGDVTIEILEGRSEYIGSTRNEVESITYGAVDGSFSFPDAEEIDVDTSIAWERPASFYGDEVGAEFTVMCREGGEPDSVWGTDVYTNDSSICTAAVHAGLIDQGESGEVTFEVVGGQDSYDGSTAHGVTSLDYGEWETSFTFVE